MSATVNVLATGYVGERVASTVVLVRENDVIIIVDPGMVRERSVILDPLHALGVNEDEVTDIIISHHHPDHTLNAALFPRARVHDVWAIYDHDVWGDRSDVIEGAPSVSLLDTPGHTPQDISTVIETDVGIVVCTHVWWSLSGPMVDPLAANQDLLEQSRQIILRLNPVRIIPGHGEPFTPTDLHQASPS